jgi:threonine dehydrogenase-like Zn-dependent dehydrogenase
MEAHGAPFGKFAQTMAGFLPAAVAEKLIDVASVDRLSALYLAIDLVRRGGTISLSGVYGGQMDPIPMMELFDKQIQVRMGQANVKRWVDDILPLLEGDEDPLGVDEFATHRIPIERAPEAYETFQKKSDGMVKTLIQP